MKTKPSGATRNGALPAEALPTHSRHEPLSGSKRTTLLPLPAVISVPVMEPAVMVPMSALIALSEPTLIFDAVTAPASIFEDVIALVAIFEAVTESASSSVAVIVPAAMSAAVIVFAEICVLVIVPV